MKKQIAYIAALLCALLCAPSCSKEAPQTDAAGTGTLVMRISATRTDATAEYDPFDYATVRIYNGRGELTRKYSSLDDLPASLELLAGDYRIAVEAGDGSKATFTNRTYRGEKQFTIVAGQSQQVQVECLLSNAVVEVKFDASVPATFGEEFHAWVMAADAFDQTAAEAGHVPALRYTTDAKGYFILPQGATTFACRFSGEHPTLGQTIEHTQLIEQVKPQGKYVLTYKFSPDLPGFISLKSIVVDTSEDEQDDTIIFSPDPTITGVGFEFGQTQPYTTGDKSFEIRSIVELQQARMTFGGIAYDLLSATPGDGVSVVQNSATSLTLTLSDALFANRTGGNHKLQFQITDTGNGTLDTEATFRLEGILPVSATDMDLWTNTVTLRAVSFDAANEVKLALKLGSEAWQEATATLEADDIYAATLSPEWLTQTNAHDLTVHRAKAGTGVFAGHTYSSRATVAGTQTTFQFTTTAGDVIPNGDMEGSLSCFGTDNVYTTTWGSGNNSMAKGLCVKAPSKEKEGIGGEQCAKMVASNPGALVYLAAGNLFFSTFEFKSPFGPGTVGFGQKYAYTARPSALAVKYHAKVGKVTANDFNGPLAKDTQDISTIFVCIIDWQARHNVVSGTSGPSGLWDPAKQTALKDSGEIIAYGCLDINESTAGDALIPTEIPLNFYDTEAPAPTGKYTLIISCSTSKYGDSMNGCDSNVLYVDDFEWVY